MANFTQICAQLGAESSVYTSIIYNDILYAGTGQNALLYRLNSAGNAWEQVCANLNGQKQIRALAIYNDRLYGSTYAFASPGGGRLFRLNSGGDAWEQICARYDGIDYVGSLAVFEGRLYGGGWSGRLLRLNSAGDAWEEVAAQLNGQTNIPSLIVYNSRLYGTTSTGGKLFRLNSGGDAWEEICDTLDGQTEVSCLAVFNGRLYGGTTVYQGGRLFRLNSAGDAWEQVCANYNSENAIRSLFVFGGRLYGGTGSNGRLFRLNSAGNAWEQICDTLDSQSVIYSLCNFENNLYGTTSSGGRLFRATDISSAITTKSIFAIRIYLDSDPTVSNASDIGLYDDADNGANQVFRWIEDDISTYSPTYTWKTGVLSPNGFGNISEGVETIDGGNLPEISGSNFTVTNTLIYGGVFTQFDKILSDNDLYLYGLRCDIIEFEIAAGILIDPDGTVVFRGAISDIAWNEKQYKAAIEPTVFKRRSNLATVMNQTDFDLNDDSSLIGKSLPVSFGEFNGKYARLVQSADLVETYNNRVETLNVTEEITVELTAVPDYYGLEQFPVVSTDSAEPTLVYGIRIIPTTPISTIWKKANVLQTTGKLDLTYFENKYIKVVEGSQLGAIRKIVSAEVDLDVDRDVILLTIEKYFVNDLSFASDAKAENQSWVEVLEYNKSYHLDYWPCGGFVDENSVLLDSGNEELYSYEAPKTSEITVTGAAEVATGTVLEGALGFYRLPEYAFESTSDNNEVNLIASLFQNDPNTMNSYLIKSAESGYLLDHDNLSAWEVDGDSYDYTSMVKLQSGIYHKYPGNGLINPIVTTSGSASNIIDGDEDTYYGLEFDSDASGSNSIDWAIVYGLRLPEAPANFEFDNVYLGVRMFTTTVSIGTPIFRFLYATWRRFMGYAFEASDRDVGANYNDTNILPPTPVFPDDYGQVNSTPDFYFGNNDNNDKFFYYLNPKDGGIYDQEVSGYTRFELDGVSTKNYSSVFEIALIYMRRSQTNYKPRALTRLNEAMFIYSKKVSIKDAIYARAKGRIYDDTWGGRKTAANMINNPIDIAENVLRLGNWSEQDEVEDWGKTYATDPLIDTTTNEGGFDYSDLDTIKALRPARQILDYGQAWSDEIIRSLCASFFLVSYQDPATSNEKIAYIAEKSKTTPTTTITLDDIIGDISEVQYPEMRGIYCEPLVRYGKNNATGEYDKVIQITNANAASFDSSYVIGLSGSSAELMWARAHVLWEAFRQIEKPPGRLTSNDWIVTEDDAVWYLDTWLDWMGAVSTDGTPSGVVFEPKKRYSITVPYAVGKSWFLTQHHLLQLPHQTNDTAIEFMIERISKNINRGQEAVTIQMMLYGSSTSISDYVQDVYTPGTLLDDWQDTYDTQTDTPANGNDIQDIT